MTAGKADNVMAAPRVPIDAVAAPAHNHKEQQAVETVNSAEKKLPVLLLKSLSANLSVSLLLKPVSKGADLIAKLEANLEENLDPNLEENLEAREAAIKAVSKAAPSNQWAKARSSLLEVDKASSFQPKQKST